MMVALPLLIWYPLNRAAHQKIRQQLQEKGLPEKSGEISHQWVRI